MALLKNRRVARRDALKGVGAVAGAAAVGTSIVATNAGAVGHSTSTPHVDPPAPPHTRRDLTTPGADVRAFFGPVREGTVVGDLRVERIYGLKMGAVPVVLSTVDGRSVQVNVHRRDPSGINGVGNEGGITVVVANRGRGEDNTDEQIGLGAMALAAALADREQSGASLPTLLTIEQRSRRFPAGVFEVPV